MNRILGFFAILCIPLSLFGQKWQWLYPYPTSNSIIDFCFPDKNNGFLIAENGEILKTNDGGITWKTKTIKEFALVDIFCLNKRDIWILAKNSDYYYSYTLIISDDNGENWQTLPITLTSSYYNCIFFVSKQIGWLAGENGNFALTSNGGKTWTDKPIGQGYAGPNIRYIHFTDDINGIFIGYYNGIVLGRTNDGGKSWILKESGFSNNIYAGCYSEENAYYTVGDRGVILKTNDFGTFWSFPGGIINNSLYGISFPDSMHGWAVGEESTILRTTDGGNSWDQQSINWTSDFKVVQFLDSMVGWVLGKENYYDSGSVKVQLKMDF